MIVSSRTTDENSHESALKYKSGSQAKGSSPHAPSGHRRPMIQWGQMQMVQFSEHFSLGGSSYRRGPWRNPIFRRRKRCAPGTIDNLQLYWAPGGLSSRSVLK